MDATGIIEKGGGLHYTLIDNQRSDLMFEDITFDDISRKRCEDENVAPELHEAAPLDFDMHEAARNPVRASQSAQMQMHQARQSQV